MNEQLQKEFEYFLKNRDEFSKKHKGKTLVISNKEVVGIYDDKASAYNAALSILKLKPGSFIIQEASSDPSSYMQVFHSRVL